MTTTTVNTNYTAKPNIKIPLEVYRKVMHWVNKATGEVSGFGKVIWKDGAYHVLDAYLVEQENGAATTDIDASAMSKLMVEKIRDPGHLNWWWHSHVNMGVFWSGTDVATIKEIGGQGMCVATVFNKRGEQRSAFCQAATEGGFLPALIIDELPLEVVYPVIESVTTEWDAEFEANCKTKVWKGYGGYGGNGYGVGEGGRRTALWVPLVDDHETGKPIPHVFRAEQSLDWESMTQTLRDQWIGFLQTWAELEITPYPYKAKELYISFQWEEQKVAKELTADTEDETFQQDVLDFINEGAKNGA